MPHRHHNVFHNTLYTIPLYIYDTSSRSLKHENTNSVSLEQFEPKTQIKNYKHFYVIYMG